MNLILQQASKLLMIGDSITDCERTRPIGEGLFGALGKGYVSLFDAMLQSQIPEAAIRVVNMGSSGNTVRDLQARWQSDVLDQKPDWVSIMIGINDVWRQFDTPWQKEWHVSLAEYRQTLTKLVIETKPYVKGMILLSPYFIESNQTDPMRITMDRYRAAMAEIASSEQVHYVDTQRAFDQILKHMHPMTLAWDRIHPTLPGHMVIAKALLDTITS